MLRYVVLCYFMLHPFVTSTVLTPICQEVKAGYRDIVYIIYEVCNRCTEKVNLI